MKRRNESNGEPHLGLLCPDWVFVCGVSGLPSFTNFRSSPWAVIKWRWGYMVPSLGALLFAYPPPFGLRATKPGGGHDYTGL